MYLKSPSVDSPFPQRLVQPSTAESLGCTADQKPTPPADGYLKERKTKRDSPVRPIVCALPSLARSRASHRGVAAQVQNAALSSQLGRSLAPPCQPGWDGTKTQIKFKQLKRIPRRVMRKDRNRNIHTRLPRSDRRIVISTPGKQTILPSECEGGGRARAAKKGVITHSFIDGRASNADPASALSHTLTGAVRPR